VKEFRRLLLLIFIMASISISVSAAAISLLYGTSLEQQRVRLIEIAQSQARLIEAMARFDQRHQQRLHPGYGNSAASTISQIIDAHSNYKGFGDTGEFTLARREGNQIVFLLSHRHYDLDNPVPLDFNSRLAEPMRLALAGKSGTVIGPDYRGETVLAAYEPVAVLDLGIVAKIDLSEIRAPFVRTGGIAIGLAILIVLCGAFLFIRITRPMLLQLQDSEERFRATFEQAAVGIAQVGTDGRWLKVNQTLCDILGYSREELLGLTFQDITHPEDLDADLDYVNQMLSGKIITYSMKKRYIRKDRTVIWINLTVGRVKNPDDTIKYFVSVIEDITREKKMQENLGAEKNFSNALIDSLPGVFYMFDREGRFLRWNKNFETVTRYTHGEIAKMTPHDLFTGADRKRIADSIERVFIKGKVTVEASFLAKTGEKIPFLFTGRLIEHNKKPYLVGVGMNISIQKQTQDQLKHLNENLVRSNRELEQFAYVASHDLQEPLRMVASYVQLLAKRYEDKLDDDAKDFIRFAVDGATRMKMLIQDLLSYSRVATRGKPMEMVDAHEILGEALANLRLLITETATMVITDDLPVVRGDRSQLVLVFQNLINNAIKFRKKNELPRIHVSAQKQEGEWIFSVNDNGIGIEEKYHDRIFAIFQRLHTKQEYPGTGIGLPLCRRIIERHEGKIWMESEPGEGTTFYFTLAA